MLEIATKDIRLYLFLGGAHHMLILSQVFPIYTIRYYTTRLDPYKILKNHNTLQGMQGIILLLLSSSSCQ